MPRRLVKEDVVGHTISFGAVFKDNTMRDAEQIALGHARAHFLQASVRRQLHDTVALAQAGKLIFRFCCAKHAHNFGRVAEDGVRKVLVHGLFYDSGGVDGVANGDFWVLARDTKFCQNVLEARHAELSGNWVHTRTKGVERKDLV